MTTTKKKNPVRYHNNIYCILLTDYFQEVFFTRDVGRHLLVEGADINLDTEWSTILPYEEYTTGITASENYVFVTGRIWM